MNSSAWAQLYRYGLFISVPLMIAGVFLLGFSIVQVIRMMRKAQLAILPLVEQQEVELPEGRVDLYGEGPLLTSRFWHLTFELTGDDHIPVQTRPVLFRTSSSSFSKVRLQLRVCHIPKPGRYVLRIGGLGVPQEKDAQHNIVFTRPLLLKSLVCILGILLGAGLFIGDLVLFLLRLIYGPNIPVQ